MKVLNSNWLLSQNMIVDTATVVGMRGLNQSQKNHNSAVVLSGNLPKFNRFVVRTRSTRLSQSTTIQISWLPNPNLQPNSAPYYLLNNRSSMISKNNINLLVFKCFSPLCGKRAPGSLLRTSISLRRNVYVDYSGRAFWVADCNSNVFRIRGSVTKALSRSLCDSIKLFLLLAKWNVVTCFGLFTSIWHTCNKVRLGVVNLSV